MTPWCPTGPQELALVAASRWWPWPPRLPDQLVLCPVLNEDYATRIARDCNVKASGAGHGTRFQAYASFLDHYPVPHVRGKPILKYWIPAADLPARNDAIVGRIDLVASFSA